MSQPHSKSRQMWTKGKAKFKSLRHVDNRQLASSSTQIPSSAQATNTGTHANATATLESPITLPSGATDAKTTEDATVVTVDAANESSEPTEPVEAPQPVGSTKSAEAPDSTGATKPMKAPWHLNQTPQWNAAVETWKAVCPAHFLELEQMIEERPTMPGSGVEALFHLQPAKKSSSEMAARWKRWQPALASARGIVMAAAKFDPHKVAPIVCASVLFGIDVSKICCLLLLADSARLYLTA